MSKLIDLNNGGQVFISDRVEAIVERAAKAKQLVEAGIVAAPAHPELSQGDQDALWAEIEAEEKAALSTEAHVATVLGDTALAALKIEAANEAARSVDTFLDHLDEFVGTQAALRKD